MLDVNDTTTAPALWRAILPLTPIIGADSDGKWGPELHIITILVAACCWRRSPSSCAVSTPKTSSRAGSSPTVEWLTPSPACDAAGCRRRLCRGLSTIGFINGLISIATSFGSASIILMLVLVILTMLAAMTTGSGNAPFYAFVGDDPRWRTPPASIRLPVDSDAAPPNLGHPISPVSGWWSLPGWRRFPHSKWSSAPQCRCSLACCGDRCY